MKTKKVMALFLSFVMLMAMGTTAFAAPAEGSAHSITTVIDTSGSTKTENYGADAKIDLLLYTEGERVVKSVKVTGSDTYFDSTFTIPSNGQLPNGTQFNIERREVTSGVYGIYFRTVNALADTITLNITTQPVSGEEDKKEDPVPTPTPTPAPVTHTVTAVPSRYVYVSNENITVEDKKSTSVQFSTSSDYCIENIIVKINGKTQTLSLYDTDATVNGHYVTISRSTDGSVIVTINSVTADIELSATASFDIYTIQLASVTGVSYNTDSVQFVYHGDSMTVQLTPSKNYVIEDLRIATDYETFIMDINEDYTIRNNFKVSATENSSNRVTLKITGITSDIKVTPVTDRTSTSSKDRIYITHSAGSQTKIELSETNWVYYGDTFTTTVTTTNTSYGIRSVTIEIGNSTVTINRNDKSFKLDGTTYYTTWKHSGNFEVLTFSVKATKDLHITSRSANLNQLDELIYNSSASHALTKSTSGNTEVTFSPTTPVSHNEDTKVIVKSSNVNYGINTVRVAMGDFSTTVQRNAESFKLGGITYKCHWAYDGRYETMTFTIPVTNDMKVTANGSPLTELSQFKPTKNESDTKTYHAYMQGYGNQMFGPQNNITNAEAVTMLVNLFLDVSDSTLTSYAYSATYSDVAGGKWYSGAIGYAQSMGYLSVLPIDGNRFNPDANINRAGLIALISSFSGQNANTASTSVLSKYTDVPSSHWAAKYIAHATTIGWVQGYGNGQFGPNNNVTRAEAATMCNNATSRPAFTGGYLNTFRDVTPSDWFYTQVMSATNDIVIAR